MGNHLSIQKLTKQFGELSPEQQEVYQQKFNELTASGASLKEAMIAIAEFDKTLRKFATASEIRQALSPGAIVIDVRGTDEAMAAGDTVEGARVIPFVPEDQGKSFAEEVQKGALPEDKDTSIVVYDSDGARAWMALDALNELGYTNVINGATSAAINSALSQFASNDFIRDNVGKDAILLDVRGKEEAANAGDQVEGSTLIPWVVADKGESFAAAVAGGALADDKEKSIIVYCRSGRRAGWAIDKLKELGFNNVANGCTGTVIRLALQA